MFEAEESNPDRARLRPRDVGAAWLLVVLITAAIPLPSVLSAVRVDAIHAADAARDEVVAVLYAVPGLIRPIASRVATIANANATPVRSGGST